MVEPILLAIDSDVPSPKGSLADGTPTLLYLVVEQEGVPGHELFYTWGVPTSVLLSERPEPSIRYDGSFEGLRRDIERRFAACAGPTWDDVIAKAADFCWYADG